MQLLHALRLNCLSSAVIMPHRCVAHWSHDRVLQNQRVCIVQQSATVVTALSPAG